MPFVIQGLRLPFVKVSTTPKTGRTLVWHAGPWQYNARTGQHSLKLGKRLKYTSRTRTAKAADKKTKALKRDAERKSWDEHFASRATGAPATPAPGPRPAKKAALRRTGTPGTVKKPAATNASVARLSGAAVPGGPGGPLSFTQLRERGFCGATTREGRSCLNNAGSCPHHSNFT